MGGGGEEDGISRSAECLQMAGDPLAMGCLFHWSSEQYPPTHTHREASPLLFIFLVSSCHIGMTVAHAHVSPAISFHAAIKVLKNLSPLMFTLRLSEPEGTLMPS